VLVNNRPALRVLDFGLHAACCGVNLWRAILGSTTVLINNLPAHRKGDMDIHCGGVGQLIEGSDDVLVGGAPGGAGGSAGPGGGGGAAGQASIGVEGSTSRNPMEQAIEQAATAAAERGTPLISRNSDLPCGGV